MKDSQSMKLHVHKDAIMQLLCIGLLFLYCINPTTAWTATAIPPADHESILYALEFAKLSSFKNVLWAAINKEGFLVPPSATIFVPTNAAIDAFTVFNQNFTNLSSYHIKTLPTFVHIISPTTTIILMILQASMLELRFLRSSPTTHS
jgi:hypothetical protein